MRGISFIISIDIDYYAFKAYIGRTNLVLRFH